MATREKRRAEGWVELFAKPIATPEATAFVSMGFAYAVRVARPRALSLNQSYKLYSIECRDHKEHPVAGPAMIHQLDWRELRGRHFVPQAVIGKAPADFADAFDIQFSLGEDDLYYFEGALLRLDDKVDFILKRYERSEEQGKVTVYLPYEVSNVQDIAEMVSSIVRELKISTEDILWQRNELE